MSAYLLIFIGGGIGSALRYGVGQAAAALLDTAVPFGTLAVNALGGLLIGLLVPGLTGSETGSLRLLLVAGVFGGFTTFSAFSLEAVTIWQRGQEAQQSPT